MRRDSSSIFSSSKIPIAALAAILVIAALEVFVWATRNDFTDALGVITREKKALLCDERLREDVVVFGSSQMFSVIPARVSDALGGGATVTNYSWPFAGWEMYDYALEAYMAMKRHAPRAIVVSFEPQNFGQPEKYLRLPQQPEYAPRAFNFLPVATLYVDLVHDGYYATLFEYLHFLATPPTSRYRREINEIPVGLVSKDRAPLMTSAEERMVEDWRDDGAFLLYTDEVAPPTALADWEGYIGGLTLRRDQPVWLFERMLKRARDNGVEVLLLNPPVSKALYNRLVEEGIVDYFETLIRKWDAAYPNLHVAEPVAWHLPNDYFGDVAHVNARGDEKFREFYEARLREAAPELGFE